MSHDTWIHKGVRRLVRPLVGTPVTPNQITTLRLIGGLAAAGVLAQGTREATLAGAGLFVLSFVLDRADGELARLSGKGSRLGHLFDLWSDALCNALIFVGLGAGLMKGELGGWALPMGLAAGISIGTILWAVMRVEAAKGARAAEIGSLGGFDPDDAILFVPLALVLGWSEPLLWAASTVTPLFAAGFLFAFRRDLFSAAPPGESA